MESTELKNLELIAKGKVRDIYAVDSDHLLIVTTDRMSAFDVVLPNPIPGKGEVLTELSEFWFKKTQSIVKNHMTDDLDLVDRDRDRVHAVSVKHGGQLSCCTKSSCIP